MDHYSVHYTPTVHANTRYVYCRFMQFLDRECHFILSNIPTTSWQLGNTSGYSHTVILQAGNNYMWWFGIVKWKCSKLPLTSVTWVQIPNAAS